MIFSRSGDICMPKDKKAAVDTAETSKAVQLYDKKTEAAAYMEQIKNKFGEGAIMKFGEVRKTNVDAIPTGCLSLDIAFGIGGVPPQPSD